MKLNNNISFTLIHLLGGANSAAEIAQRMPAVNLRSIQRALVRLTEEGIIERQGVTNPRYNLNYEKLIGQPINSPLLENINRPNSSFNFGLLEWLLSDNAKDLATIFSVDGLSASAHHKIAKRKLEHLTVELSWKSSALEGNTYSLLDTELLLLQGVRAKNKTNFETRMILNHKVAIDFIIDHPELFIGEIAFSTVEEIHQRISYDLGINSGIRRQPVQISTSNYEPLANPAKLKECAISILCIINRQHHPFIKALIALSSMPYLQPFEDGNKRVGRILANAILLHSIGRGFSLRNIDAKQLALAYLSFYEFNSLEALAKILKAELHRERD